MCAATSNGPEPITKETKAGAPHRRRSSSSSQRTRSSRSVAVGLHDLNRLRTAGNDRALATVPDLAVPIVGIGAHGPDDRVELGRRWPDLQQIEVHRGLRELSVPAGVSALRIDPYAVCPREEVEGTAVFSSPGTPSRACPGRDGYGHIDSRSRSAGRARRVPRADALSDMTVLSESPKALFSAQSRVCRPTRPVWLRIRGVPADHIHTRIGPVGPDAAMAVQRPRCPRHDRSGLVADAGRRPTSLGSGVQLS